MIGLSISYNGTYLGGASYGLRVIGKQQHVQAGVVLDFQPFAARDGGVTQGAVMGPKIWSDTYEIEGTSRSDAVARLDNVKAVLDPTTGVAALRYDRDINLGAAVDREYLARVNGAIGSGTWANPAVIRISVPWIVPGGRARALSATTITPAISSSPDTFTIPTDGTSLVGGTTQIRPVFTFRNTTGGNVTSIIFTNSTLSQTLRWAGVLSDTYYIRIDSERQHLTRSATGDFAGEETNAMSGLTAGDPFPLLADRVNNSFSLTGFSSAASTIEYREEFL